MYHDCFRSICLFRTVCIHVLYLSFLSCRCCHDGRDITGKYFKSCDEWSVAVDSDKEIDETGLMKSDTVIRSHKTGKTSLGSKEGEVYV